MPTEPTDTTDTTDTILPVINYSLGWRWCEKSCAKHKASAGRTFAIIFNDIKNRLEILIVIQQ